MEQAVTQDNLREKQIIHYCGLCDNEDSRIGNDAYFRGKPFEVKSVTKKKGVSTARQVHSRKINKWRSQYWVIARGPKRPDGMEIEELYLAHPEDLEPFFSQCEEKINRKMRECDIVLDVAAQYCTEEQIRVVEEIVEVGTRLDDPNIPWGLVQQTMPLPVDDPGMANLLIDIFVEDRPIGKDSPDDDDYPKEATSL